LPCFEDMLFYFSSRRRHTRSTRDWSSDVCSSDLKAGEMVGKLEIEVPDQGVKDVGLELIKAGLAKRQTNYDYKYRELSAAEAERSEERRVGKECRYRWTQNH